MGRIRILVPMLLALLLVTVGPARAQEGLNIVKSFEAGGNQLDFATYAQNNDKVSLVGIVTPEARASFAFSPAEWEEFAKNWEQAKAAVQPEATTWTTVAVMQETDTEELAVLTIRSGASVQFLLQDPEAGTLIFTLDPGDIDAFSAAIKKVKAFFGR